MITPWPYGVGAGRVFPDNWSVVTLRVIHHKPPAISGKMLSRIGPRLRIALFLPRNGRVTGTGAYTQPGAMALGKIIYGGKENHPLWPLTASVLLLKVVI